MSHEYELKPFRAPVELHIDYAGELNPEQLAAVTAPPGPALVLAGAGAGKTRTLTYRVAFLLEQGVPPDRILLLTFTNKAAKEMMRRVAELLGGDLRNLWGGTFHSIGNRLLRRHADRAGYQSDFTILDTEDAKHLLSACLGDSHIDTKKTRFPKPDVLGGIFSFAINTEQPIGKVLAGQYPHFAALEGQIQHLYDRYQERKRATNVMDFDDLLVLWLKMLRDHGDLCERYQRQFQFILVDEYQDTNKIQSDIVDLLAARHHNVMAVGDDSQSIYSWRGANFRNILEFPKRHPHTTVFKVEQNYRSTPEILHVANTAIAANVNQFEKKLAPVRKTGPKPALVVCADAQQQAAFVAQRALELREEGMELKNMAVLYRSHFHAMELQMELTRRNIPFTITSGVRFFEQAHVKDVTAWLKIVANPRDELAFKRLVLMMPGVGPKAADRLWKSFAEPTVSADASPAPSPEASAPARKQRVQRAEAQPVEPTVLGRRLSRCLPVVPGKAEAEWKQFAETLKQIAAQPICDQPARMIKTVMEAGYENYVKETFENFQSRLEDLEQLIQFSRQYQSLADFLAELSLQTNVEAEDEGRAAADDERIRLSSIHQAKGLEFDVVFVIMLCEGLFPNFRALEDPEKEEEERRLFYVAITRARNELYLSYPLLRFTQGYEADPMQRPSRFIQEIKGKHIDEWSLKARY